MSEISFVTGGMNSSKSTAMLIKAYNLMEKGKHVLILKPWRDTRDEDVEESDANTRQCVFNSRIVKSDLEGFATKNVAQFFEKDMRDLGAALPEVIFLDEAQFFSKDDITYIEKLNTEHDIPVHAYGLRVDAFGNFFPGSEQLLRIADNLEDMSQYCSASGCMNKAIMGLRYGRDGKVVKTGSQVEIGGNDKYKAVCRKHWKDGMQR
ncbi:MAG: hypothetical protein FWF01_04020 [Alphaproteobacteria bacterium]|nr:hypothetical protein [Alphaproteobacteria bacterium]